MTRHSRFIGFPFVPCALLFFSITSSAQIEARQDQPFAGPAANSITTDGDSSNDDSTDLSTGEQRVAQDHVDRVDAIFRTRIRVESQVTSLGEFFRVLRRHLALPIEVDTTAIEAAGLSLESELVINEADITVEAAIELVLDHFGLELIVTDSQLIVSAEGCPSPILRVYNITDLAPIGGPFGRAFYCKRANNRTDQLIVTIQNNVTVDEWANFGGEAQIEGLVLGPHVLLIVQHTFAGHREISAMLKRVRRELAPHPESPTP